MSDANTAAAVKVLQSFVEANARGDDAGMRALLTRGSLESGAFSGPQPGVNFSLGEATTEGEAVVIPISARPAEAPPDSPAQTLPGIMVREDGEWKFDLAASTERLMSAMQEAMGAVAAQMGDAMGQAMEGMADAMKEAFGDISEQMTEEMAEVEELRALAEEDAARLEAEEAAAEALTDEPPVTNALLFQEAIAGLESAVPAWQMQVEMALGHPTPLTVAWKTLGGRYELVQGMVHVGVVQSLAAVSAVGFHPETKQALSDAVQSVRIEHVEGVAPGNRVGLRDGELTFWIDAMTPVEGPPDGSLAGELRRAIGFDSGDSGAIGIEPVAEAPAFMSGDMRGQAALAYMARLEELMRDANLWPGDPPEGPLEVRGAFGCENMAFEQWLGWVLIPRVRSIVETGDSFPSGSMVGTYAARALDGANAGDVIGLLYEFDQLFNE